jgi:hypothetical protein
MSNFLEWFPAGYSGLMARIAKCDTTFIGQHLTVSTKLSGLPESAERVYMRWRFR